MTRYIDADKIEYEDMLYPRGDGNYEECQIAYRNRIDNIPAADVRENVMGEWICWYEKIENDTCTEYRPHCKCSECGTEYDSHTVKFINFCPNCGAKMGGNYDLQSYTGIY